MAEFTVKIVYAGPVVDVASTQVGMNIARTFVQAKSYVDTAAYDGTIYDTNVDGWGSLDGLDPFGDGTYKFAWLGQAIAAGDDGVEFTVAGAEEQLYWTVLAKAMASQGFTITVTPVE